MTRAGASAPASFNPETEYFEATDRLLHGRLREGFKQYEVRWQTAHQKPYAKNYSEPRWTGQDLTGKTIFVWHEQGFGDTIMMHRYLRMLEGGTVKVAVQTPLRKLFAHNLNSEIVEDGEVECDYQIPTLSLPYAFGTTVETIPPPAPIKQLKPFLMETPDCLNVGIQWAGNINHPDDMARSVPFTDLARLLKVKGVKFWGLQRNVRPVELMAIERSNLTCLWFDGFDMLAAIVAKMDLIITCDSALAHLAGAMGKPTWTLIQANPDWRWMLKRGDTPWYPTMRLFRQRSNMHWRPVIDHVAELLRRKRDHAASL